MISHDDLYAVLKEKFPDAEINLEDMTGGQDHWKAMIRSEAFVGLRKIARHRKVYAALGDLMAGPIHALSLDTKAPDEP